MRKIIAANWKMNLSTKEAGAFFDVLSREIGTRDTVDVVIVPPFTIIPRVSEIVTTMTRFGLGAQNMHYEGSGAFTGEISAAMLKEFYVRWVVIGHSERRALFGETDEMVNRKVKAAHEAVIKPIMCIGESLGERDAGEVETVLDRQLRAGLAGVDAARLPDTVIAYEPVWAIGTGRTATPEQAQEAHAFVRRVLADLYSEETANKVRIQYGGSVKPDNAKALLSQPDVDGALVGGASLDGRSFGAIVNAAIELDS